MLVLVLGAVAASGAVCAQEEAPPPRWKLITGLYHFSTTGAGLDTNLRYQTQAVGDAWIGYFRAPRQDASQWRAGWDHSFGQWLRISPSLQTASGGFWGGSLNLEAGDQWVAGAGLGRTNLRPYYNLNFDPNDSWSLMGAYRPGHGISYTVSLTRDNRLNPDQRHLHLVYRAPIDGDLRLTLDLLAKRGLVDGRLITRAGLSVTVDWPRRFIRLAYDPKTNFTRDNSLRLSAGLRF